MAIILDVGKRFSLSNESCLQKWGQKKERNEEILTQMNNLLSFHIKLDKNEMNCYFCIFVRMIICFAVKSFEIALIFPI